MPFPLLRSRAHLRRIALVPLTALLAGALLAGAAPIPEGGDRAASVCVPADARLRAPGAGSDPNDLSGAAVLAAEQELSAASRQQRVTRATAAKKAVVEVHYHVIVRDDGSGGVTTARIRKQTRVLNRAFGGSGRKNATTIFRFRTASIDVTANSDWFDWSLEADTDDLEAKPLLRRGALDELNVYVTGLQDGLLGYATFPFEVARGQDPALDGVVVLSASLPGGAAAPYNRGDTVTHEVGHWLGLYHSFENGCSGSGDMVRDTPAQSEGDTTLICDAALDTCAGPGRDPVHNFMNYGDDDCIDRFTKGQARRMARLWHAFRAGAPWPVEEETLFPPFEEPTTEEPQPPAPPAGEPAPSATPPVE